MERPELIRPQVLLYKRGKVDSGVVITHSNALSTLAWLAICLFALLIVVLLSIRYKQTTPARGVLLAADPPENIVAPISAKVLEVLVKEGQLVAEGELLATLSTAQLDGSGLRPQELEIQHLEDQSKRIRQQWKLQQKLQLTQGMKLKTSLASIELKLRFLFRSRSHSSERLRITKNNLEALKKVAAGSNISKLEFDNYQHSFIQHKEGLNAIDAEIATTQASLKDLQLAQEVLNLESLAARAKYHQQQAEIDNRKEGLSYQSMTKIVSHSSGIVSGMAINKGMAVSANQYLLQISSTDPTLQATLYVPSRVVGKLHTEQELLLSFDGFPKSEYGYYSAVIREIADAPVDPRKTELPSLATQGPVFRVAASLMKNYVEGPEVYPLRAGYEFEANFVIENLSLFEFIFKPLISVGRKAL